MSTESTFFEDEKQDVVLNCCFYYDQFYLHGDGFTVEMTDEMIAAMVKKRAECINKSKRHASV
jgi:hypothetical protein